MKIVSFFEESSQAKGEEKKVNDDEHKIIFGRYSKNYTKNWRKIGIFLCLSI